MPLYSNRYTKYPEFTIAHLRYFLGGYLPSQTTNNALFSNNISSKYKKLFKKYITNFSKSLN